MFKAQLKWNLFNEFCHSSFGHITGLEVGWYEKETKLNNFFSNSEAVGFVMLWKWQTYRLWPELFLLLCTFFEHLRLPDLKLNQIGEHKVWKSVKLWRALPENRCLCVLGLSFQHTTIVATIVPTLIWRNIEQTRWPLIATRWLILQIEINHRLFCIPSPLVLSSFWQWKNETKCSPKP